MSEKMLGNTNAEKWPSSHCDALAGFVARNAGSYNDIAGFLNERFGTNYSRNATIAKATRMGLENEGAKKMPAQYNQRRARPAPRLQPPVVNREEVALRCIEIVPRNLTLSELQPNDCRYPYGDRPYLFCGHPKMDGSSYCVPHFHLCIGSGTTSERRASEGVAA